jgi:hypothetical protein
MSDVQPLWQGEVQFRRYSDTSTQGQQIVFAVEDREALEPFIGKEGKRFMAVLVEIGDDEQPVQQPRKDVRGPLCREACDYCAMPEFWAWLASERGEHRQSEEQAKRWLLRLCDIDSRKELDTDRQAGEDFVKLVRVPFMRWQREHAGAKPQ